MINTWWLYNNYIDFINNGHDVHWFSLLQKVSLKVLDLSSASPHPPMPRWLFENWPIWTPPLPTKPHWTLTLPPPKTKLRNHILSLSYYHKYLCTSFPIHSLMLFLHLWCFHRVYVFNYENIKYRINIIIEKENNLRE